MIKLHVTFADGSKMVHAFNRKDNLHNLMNYIENLTGKMIETAEIL